ncbi:hypothetical protein BN1723_008684 [Verticillium longisporum]|uniref:Uncharacterized protein n=1 Tax=Verticillium longisporum TaxID=100787 RepID=A0A0G4M7Z0_VERLO|nr:hypothetical protein BN1723_008684 [Verticillium longisporum]CRK30387.1 hypothetical protein BN1708_000917 [Verticillium longisporum]
MEGPKVAQGDMTDRADRCAVVDPLGGAKQQGHRLALLDETDRAKRSDSYSRQMGYRMYRNLAWGQPTPRTRMQVCWPALATGYSQAGLSRSYRVIGPQEEALQCQVAGKCRSTCFDAGQRTLSKAKSKAKSKTKSKAKSKAKSKRQSAQKENG